ncbi:Microcephalin [Echinococcus granulosus]|nr:Microcephalin [Echinococcus granulosus]
MLFAACLRSFKFVGCALCKGNEMSVPSGRGKGLLHGVVAYVDIRSPFGNPAFVVSRRLTSLGATVETTRNAYVTHVIFRYGDPMTKLWAEKRGLCVVAPAWVKACVQQKCRVPEACYYLKDKEDVDLADDCNRIASRNGPLMRDEPMSAPHSEASLSLGSAIISTSIPCSKTPPGVWKSRDDLDTRTKKMDSSRKETHETASLLLRPSLSGSGLSSQPQTPTSSPIVTLTKPPPGWMRLPSPPQQVADLPLFPEDNAPAQETQPRLSDVIGSTTLSRMPLSPDVLHFVVRNFASSTTAIKKNLMPKREKPLLLAPVKVTPSQERKIVSKTPTQKWRRRNPLEGRRSSLRRQLLKSHVDALSASDGVTLKGRILKSVKRGDSGQITQGKKGLKSVEVLPQPRRRSLRLLAKVTNRVGLAMGPPETALGPTSKSVIVDSEISLNSPTVNICSPELRNSLEDFINPYVLRPRRHAGASVSAPNRPIEILFSGLNAFQRQTLIALLRSSTELSKHEVTPTLNRRLCGRADVSDSPNDKKGPKASVLAAILGTEAEAPAQRWRLADIFSTRTTTHLVSTSPFPRTINLFKAVLASIPVIDMAWVVESAKAGKWLPFRRFLISGLPPAKAAAKLQKLFSTVGCVFVAAGTSPPPAALKELIIMGGGSVSKRAIGAELVVGQKDTKKPSVSPKWVLDSILHQKVLPFARYRVMD